MEPGLKSAGELKTMEKFTNLFTDVKFRKGLDITFTCAGDTMTTRIDGKEVGQPFFIPVGSDLRLIDLWGLLIPEDILLASAGWEDNLTQVERGPSECVRRRLTGVRRSEKELWNGVGVYSFG
jgi:hypothetical protein